MLIFAVLQEKKKEACFKLFLLKNKTNPKAKPKPLYKWEMSCELNPSGVGVTVAVLQWSVRCSLLLIGSLWAALG